MASTEFVTGYQACDTEDESPSQFLIPEADAPAHVHLNGYTATAKWNHIQNLDDFFCRVYQYHQRHGFLCMLAEDVLQLAQFLFIILFTGFLTDCVNYDVLFATRTPQNKQTFNEVIITPCKVGFSNPTVAVCLLIAYAFLAIRTIKVLYNLVRYWEIKQFYTVALQIQSSDLQNKTWCEVQEKVIQAQLQIQMCVQKNELTQLDIYHRILRYKNYFIALANKSLLPLTFDLPLLGQICYLSHGLKFNLEMILFWAPCNISLFEQDWQVRDEYKNPHKRIALSNRLSRNILLIGLANLILSPLILLWQILYMFFVYGELVKREPGFLGSRKWSLYSRSYLRHFNELDHELNARLSRAYEPSNEYLNGFISPILAIIAKSMAFFCWCYPRDSGEPYRIRRGHSPDRTHDHSNHRMWCCYDYSSSIYTS